MVVQGIFKLFQIKSVVRGIFQLVLIKVWYNGFLITGSFWYFELFFYKFWTFLQIFVKKKLNFFVKKCNFCKK